MPKTATNDKGTGNELKTNSCCGGPAPSNVNACCGRDADAKASGASGCGCEFTPQPGGGNRVCCRLDFDVKLGVHMLKVPAIAVTRFTSSHCDLWRRPMQRPGRDV